jgi:modulator of FtsH protease
VTAAWLPFFATAAGAAAALTGLIFVALSVNIARILEYWHLPARAAAAMGALMLILVSSLAALAPQPLVLVGGETLAFTAFVWWLEIDSARQLLAAVKANNRPWREFAIGTAMGQVQVVPYLVGGVVLALGSAAGLYWLAAGAVMVFVLAVVNAWVLLVEILR